MEKVPEDQKAPYAAALAVHYLARRQEEVLTPLAATLNEATVSVTQFMIPDEIPCRVLLAVQDHLSGF